VIHHNPNYAKGERELRKLADASKKNNSSRVDGTGDVELAEMVPVMAPNSISISDSGKFGKNSFSNP